MINTPFLKIVLSLAVVATWVSLWVSTQPLPIDDAQVESYLKNGGATPLSGRGGWPLPAFKYPVPPLGSDTPNADAYFPFVLNVAFWIAVMTCALWFVPRRWLLPAIERTAIGLASLMTVFGVFFLLLKFD